MKTLYLGDLWGLSRPRKLALATLSIHSNLALPKRLALPYPYEEMLSGYEEDVSSVRDGFFGLGEGGP